MSDDRRLQTAASCDGSAKEPNGTDRKAMESMEAKDKPAACEDPWSSVDGRPTLLDPPQKTEHLAPSNHMRIGRYTVISELGSGGQGVVYRALHPDLPVELAIKVCNFAADPASETLLRGEAKVLCELSHPNIAKIRDLEIEVSSDNSRRCILAMDYIRGTSLADTYRQGRVSQSDAIRWLVAVSQAIDHAHRRGVLHLDLTPRNIVIDENQVPKVIDFGLSRIRSAWVQAEGPHGSSGTLGFMAPEQACGRTDDVDARSDIFSLGAILYFILTRKNSLTNGTSAELFQRAKRGDFNQASLDESDASPALKDICRKAMSIEMGDRYATSLDFATALEGELADEPETILSPRTFYAAAATVASVVIGLVFAAFLLRDNTNSQVTPSISVPLAITHVGRSNDALQFEQPLFSERAVRENDALVIRSTFHSPQYVFVISLNTDGTLQLLYPASEELPQERPVSTLTVPENDDLFYLTDGVGTQGFLVVSSSESLPPFKKWRDNLDSFEWERESSEIGWKYEAKVFTPMSWGGGSRGEIRPRDRPEVFALMLESLSSIPQVQVSGLFFPVSNDISRDRSRDF